MKIQLMAKGQDARSASWPYRKITFLGEKKSEFCAPRALIRSDRSRELVSRREHVVLRIWWRRVATDPPTLKRGSQRADRVFWPLPRRGRNGLGVSAGNNAPVARGRYGAWSLGRRKSRRGL